MNSRRILHRWLGALTLAAALAFGSSVERASAADEGPLVVNFAEAPATLDPSWACTYPDLVLLNLYSRLTEYGTRPGPNGTTQIDPNKIELSFAESIEVSDDGKVYTVKLPSGFTFPSGTPVDAAAVKYSFERAINMGGCGSYFLLDGFYDPLLVSSIETPDSTTVVVTLSRPDPNVPQLWAQPGASIVDPSVVEANGGVKPGEPNEYMTNNAAGAGPFLLESYEPNRSLVLVRNPDYFGEPPASEKIVVNFIDSDPTLLLQARNGEADVTIGLTHNSIRSLEDHEDITIIRNETSISDQIGLPNRQAPWDNRKVREAVTYAVPYQQILDNVIFGYGKLYYGPLTPNFPEFNAELSQPRVFDMERAKQLIAESGIATPIEVDLVLREGNLVHQQIATIVQATWRELDINAHIKILSPAEFYTAVESHQAQTFIHMDGPGVIDAGYFMGYDLVCSLVDSFNWIEVCIPEADELLDKARSTLDRDERHALYDEITKMWVAESPRIYVYAMDAVTVLNKRVKNYHFSHEVDFHRWGK